MGVLKDNAGQRWVALAARSLVGRAEACTVRVTSRRSSGEHAVLFWDGVRWSVRDLGSTNGTFVDGRRIAAGERAVLDAGAGLTFGGSDESWTLAHPGPPTMSARAEATGEVQVAEDGLLALPGAEEPLVTLFEDREGCWRLETDGVVRPAMDQERIEACGAWLLCIPRPVSGGMVPTTDSSMSRAMLIGSTVLRFELSRDGEYVALSLVHGDRVISLGGRVYHEILWMLARARLSDRDAGIPAGEQGWVYLDEILDTLELDLQHLNVNIYRARRQMARTGVIDVGALVERRMTTRQIRLGTGAVEIVES